MMIRTKNVGKYFMVSNIISIFVAERHDDEQ